MLSILHAAAQSSSSRSGLTAIDVAFISVLVALVSPLSAWLIARGTWGHERSMKRQERNYANRKDLYAEEVANAYRNVAILRQLTNIAKGEELDNLEDPEIQKTLKTNLDGYFERLGAFAVTGSAEMISEFEEYSRTTSDRFGRARELYKAHEGRGLTEEELGEMEGLIEAAREARNAFAASARDDLQTG